MLAAVTYKTDETYPSNSSKERKKAGRKRAEWFEIVKGELFLLKKNGKQKVKIITDPKELTKAQKRILEACHSIVI